MEAVGIEQQHVFARALGCGPEQVSRWRSGTPAYWSAAVVVRLLAERKVSLADVQAAAAVDDAAVLSDDVGREGESGGWGVCEGAEGFPPAQRGARGPGWPGASRRATGCRMNEADERDARLLEIVEAASIEGLAEHMKALGSVPDSEERHWQADALLCAILRSLGYGSVVGEYDKIEKFWA